MKLSLEQTLQEQRGKTSAAEKDIAPGSSATRVAGFNLQ